MIYRFQKIWRALNQEERQYAVFFSILGGISLLVLGWFLLSLVTTQAPTTGGSFREGLVGQPVSLNPLLAQNQAESDLTRLLFSPLSQLTESITLSKDGSYWTVRLREGLRWHDNEPLTSDDLVFTLQQIQDPSTNSPLFSSFQGAQAERLSARETKIIPPQKEPPYLFAHHLQELQVIPQHIFASIPPHNWLLSEYNLKPIGSGPYRFEKFVLESNGFIESYTLSSFTPNTLNHRPYISEIIVRFFKNQEAAESAFRFGQIDGLGGVDPYEARSIGRPAQTVFYPTSGYYGVFFNQSRNELLRSTSIRRVLSNAISRETLVKEVLNDSGEPVFGFSDASSSRPRINTPQDVLASLDWKKNEVGTLVQGDTDKEISPIEITTPDLPFLVRTAEILKESWEELGFVVSLKTIPLETVLSETIPRRDYELLLFGNIPNPPEDFYPFWHSSQIFHPGLNLSLFKSSRLDSILQEIRMTTSSAERADLLIRADEIMSDTQPAIFLFSPSYVYLTMKQLKGVQPSSSFASPADRFNNAAEWYLRTRRVFQ